MTNAFPPVTIAFDGKEYTVTSEKIWGLIGTIEEHLTFVELAGMMVRNRIQRVKICEAMAAALQYAGNKKVTPEDVSNALDVTGLIEQAAAIAAILNVAEAPARKDAQPETAKDEAPSAGKGKSKRGESAS